MLGSLDFLWGLPIDDVAWGKKLVWAMDCSEALAYLHSVAYTHRDIKSMNVLVDGLGRAKLADFGQTRCAQ